MAIWNDLTKKAQELAFTAGEKAREVASVAADKAQSAADVAKTTVSIKNEQFSMEKNYRAIGEWYVSTLGDEIPEAVADVVAAIRASQAKIAELEAARDAAKADMEAPSLRSSLLRTSPPRSPAAASSPPRSLAAAKSPPRTSPRPETETGYASQKGALQMLQRALPRVKKRRQLVF